MTAPRAGDGPGDDAGTLWQGRFERGPADELLAFTVSLPFDTRLAADDLDCSRAHVRMLARAGLLDEPEQSAILAALDGVEAELAAQTFEFRSSDEDIHTAIERRVTELAPSAGAKLHTGRSRNDQVATDLRLFLAREGRRQIERLLALADVLLGRAADHVGDPLPGYTHLQRAQPVSLAHHLLAHVWSLTRDVDRWFDCLERADVSPLGAGALAGSTLPIDPQRSAELLGFARAFDNSLDAVSDRDFVAEAMFVCALVAVHCSRLGEEVILWASDEFGFLELADEFATGSSMMPQKKNPDIAELARGKAGRVIGDLAGLLATLKGLPLAYNRDLQEDKEPLFDALDTSELALSALTGLFATATFRTARMREVAETPAAMATDLAEWLVAAGTPFRDAHAIVAELVRRSQHEDVGLAELVTLDERLGPDAASILAPGSGLARRASHGGPAPARVAEQLDAARRALDARRAELGAIGG